jgi:hypothetical protein
MAGEMHSGRWNPRHLWTMPDESLEIGGLAGGAIPHQVKIFLIVARV